MPNVGENRETLTVGQQVGGLEITEKLGVGGGVHAWAAARRDGSRGVVFALDGELGPMVRDQFLGAAKQAANPEQPAPAGVVQVVFVDDSNGAYVAGIDATGTLADLPILSWDTKRRVAIVRRICEIVGKLHEQNIAHGWLRPGNILLDNDFDPFVANAHLLDIGELCRTDAGMVWLHRVYTPPEVRHGATADMRADTYALGRILHFALCGEDPDEKDERLPRLDSLLNDASDSLVRIIRKCTSLDPNERYDNANEIVADLDRAERHVPVGTPHPEIDGAEESSMVDDERFRSRPPPKKSVRPGVAIEIKRTPEDGRAKFWSPGIAIGLGLLGATMLGIPLLVTQITGLQSTALELVMWGAAVPLGFATPGFTDARLLTRLLTAVAIAAAIVFVAPLELILAARVSGLDPSRPAAERVAALKELIKSGSREFRAIDLTDADLSGMDLSGLALDGSNFRNANCSGANFRRASLQNVDFSETNIQGAQLNDHPGAWIKGLELATCDEATAMPFGYVCADGSPVPKDAK